MGGWAITISFSGLSNYGWMGNPNERPAGAAQSGAYHQDSPSGHINAKIREMIALPSPIYSKSMMIGRIAINKFKLMMMIKFGFELKTDGPNREPPFFCPGWRLFGSSVSHT